MGRGHKGHKGTAEAGNYISLALFLLMQLMEMRKRCC